MSYSEQEVLGRELLGYIMLSNLSVLLIISVLDKRDIRTVVGGRL